ncbi:NAD-dependent epimerase/dehydratase family protein [Elusimicrobiota bacterium]
MDKKIIVITGGGGYIGSTLSPKLLNKGYKVRVLDILFYGDSGVRPLYDHPDFELFKGDIRDKSLVKAALRGAHGVVHLAAISNDPSSELNHQWTKEVNYDAIEQLVDLSVKAGVKRMVNASSSSVYGIKEESSVTEDLVLEPMTLYSRLKVDSEKLFSQVSSEKCPTVSVRSATVCGYSPRMRLDVIINILVSSAVNKKVITVFGGSQKRPNVHVEDNTDFYANLLEADAGVISGKAYNVSGENHTVMDLAKIVQKELGGDIPIEVKSTNDLRSYHISAQKAQKELGFTPKHSIREAIIGLRDAFKENKIPNVADACYYNIKTLQNLGWGK